MNFILLTDQENNIPILIAIDDISAVLSDSDGWILYLKSDPENCIAIRESALEVAKLMAKS